MVQCLWRGSSFHVSSAFVFALDLLASLQDRTPLLLQKHSARDVVLRVLRARWQGWNYYYSNFRCGFCIALCSECFTLVRHVSANWLTNLNALSYCMSAVFPLVLHYPEQRGGDGEEIEAGRVSYRNCWSVTEDFHSLTQEAIMTRHVSVLLAIMLTASKNERKGRGEKTSILPTFIYSIRSQMKDLAQWEAFHFWDAEFISLLQLTTGYVWQDLAIFLSSFLVCLFLCNYLLIYICPLNLFTYSYVL